MSHLIAYALEELRGPRPGGQGVRLRMAELLFTAVLRRHLEAAPQGGWLAGLRDPVVARALALLHEAPALDWSLERLALQCGSSRTVLAERFAKTVGQPTMHYLTQWRMQLASRLLQGSDAKLPSVAEAVGYASEAAFSRAFKNSAGMSPGEWRARHSPDAAVRIRPG
jgi:AraC-like DNA-binding protein